MALSSVRNILVFGDIQPLMAVLDENAANLVYGFVGLQNNFDLLEFDVKQQGILTALVVCCPRVSAP